MRNLATLFCLALFAWSVREAFAENTGTKAGWQYLKEGDYARAERVFEQVLNTDPQDMKAWEGYRAAFQKRKAQEEGRPDDEPLPPDPTADKPARKKAKKPLDEESSASSASSSDDSSSEPAPKPAKKKGKKRPVDDETSASSADSSSDGESKPSRSGDADGEAASEDSEPIGKIDAGALRNARRARERFDAARQELTENYRRQHSGATEIHVTYYNKELYKLLCERLGAEKGYTFDKAQKLYEATIKDMRGQLEFYLKLANYSSKPKKTVEINDIVKKTTLVDDEGNAYEPVRWKGPKSQKLVSDDAYTVWFARTDADGNDIIKKAGKGNLYIVVSDLPFESKQVQIAFTAKKLQGAHIGKLTSQKGFMDKIKDLWR